MTIPIKYYIKTFGCQMNEVDSEKIAGILVGQGHKLVKNVKEADTIIINTCSVREAAENRVYGLINNLSKNYSGTKIIVTGCMLRYPLKTLKEKMPEVSEFKKIKEILNGENKKAIRNDKTHAYVSIMEGCNNFCTYCVVPYARGREESRLFEEIVCEIKELVDRGYEEITLLGQNVNSYQPSFAKLLMEIHKISQIKKISFMTSNPWDLSDDIIEALKLPKIDRYLHLPVQSGDDEVLRQMNRHYTSKDYLKLVDKIRQAVPDISIGTDIIVGFPGETEEQFKNTIALCKKADFVKAYISKYSPRPQTAAFKLKDNISSSEKKRRWRELEELINR